eukprot:CAMPEP_0181130256 /NCGR_PEP_ID=MMETSP1071-20121207/29764_1 /TAXON_ID=35127 /ORGANISM="Thalassiosira sp., Strain NH16" /LENGTH=161 /DNA_ID=CAMNT_0023216309 /DNA_START=154 /DNA_END=640 /DNA_ORIENTATION=+
MMCITNGDGSLSTLPTLAVPPSGVAAVPVQYPNENYPNPSHAPPPSTLLASIDIDQCTSMRQLEQQASLIEAEIQEFVRLKTVQLDHVRGRIESLKNAKKLAAKDAPQRAAPTSPTGEAFAFVTARRSKDAHTRAVRRRPNGAVSASNTAPRFRVAKSRDA